MTISINMTANLNALLFYGDDKMFSFISINITWDDLISANAVGSSCCHILLLRNHLNVT